MVSARKPLFQSNMRTAIILLYTYWSAGLHKSFTESKELSHIVGERVHFRTAVKNTGFLLRDDSQIAKVIESTAYITNGRYSDRLQWDSSTGFFSLAGLKMEDSGVYQVQNSDGPQTVDMKYRLIVFNPVGRPQVSSRNRVKPHCSVLCSVENGRELTLSWHREGQTLSHTSSPNLSTPLSLLLEIEENSAPYSCVAENPARKEIFQVKPEEYCYGVVSTPRIQTSAAQGGRSCWLQCSVQNGREITLSWRTQGETLSHTGSPKTSPLSLSLQIQPSNFTYTCVAKNPVSEERAAFHPTQVCGPQDHCSHDALLYIMFALRLVEFVLVTLAVVLLLNLYRAGRILTPHSTPRRPRRRRRSSELVTEL